MSDLVRAVVGSLTFRCVSCVVIYALALYVLLSGAQAQSQRLYSDAYTSVETLVEDSSSLENDCFGELAGQLSPRSEAIVFDANGRQLFASTPEIARQIGFDDLFIVANSDEEAISYMVFEFDEGTVRGYEILLCSFDFDTGITRMIDSCICDQDLQIVEGTLFSPRSRLTSREFSLITGNYQANRAIEKYEYETVDGEARVLVLVAPKVNEETFQHLSEASQRVWATAIPIALLLTVVAIVVMFRVIKNSMQPLGAAIRAKEGGTADDDIEGKLPLELRDTYHTFSQLMDVLDRAKEENHMLIADISHDLKTPLAVIAGYARALEDRKVPAHKQQTYLHALYAKSCEANALLDALFSLARLDHPAFSPDLVCSNLCEEVRLATIACSPQIEESGDELAVDIEDGPLAAMIDRQLFGRVMGNIISNACKHNPSGITILVTCHVTGDHARISVADSGVGFSAAIREHAFEPFVTQNVARESDKGTGLGLAIAKKGIEAQGGVMYLSESPLVPYTTEIVMELPLCSSRPKETKEASP